MADDSVALADPVGWALVGVGAAAAIAGGVMVGIAASRDRTAESAADHDRFLAELEGARVQQTAGLVMFGVGTALAVGGVVRLLVVRQRREHPRTRIGARGVTFQF
ncbi:MAG: hypothetical protein JKY37_24225 [Nannocystaceae bacterium]|nr:hypothetical protein [Nannocystaceae bacterium]